MLPNPSELTDSIKYDNFYKFATSLSLVALIAFCALATVTITLNVPHPRLFWISLGIYSVLVIVAALCFAISIKMWHDYQNLLDQKLRMEVNAAVVDYVVALGKIDSKELESGMDQVFKSPLERLAKSSVARKHAAIEALRSSLLEQERRPTKPKVAK